MPEVSGGENSGDANLQSEFPRRFTSLWIGTTTKVRWAVVPLSSGY